MFSSRITYIIATLGDQSSAEGQVGTMGNLAHKTNNPNAEHRDGHHQIPERALGLLEEITSKTQVAFP